MYVTQMSASASSYPVQRYVVDTTLYCIPAEPPCGPAGYPAALAPTTQSDTYQKAAQ